jgi:hypothetical protein
VIKITTTGAIYQINSLRVDIYRRISPKTNSNTTPRLVCQLNFSGIGITNARVLSATKAHTAIECDQATFKIYNDSLLIITSLVEGFTYTCVNLMPAAEWQKEFGNSAMYVNDGDGGFLYGGISNYSISRNGITTTIILGLSGQISHAVYPPRQFNFNNLYGTDSYPAFKLVQNDQHATTELLGNTAFFRTTARVGTVVIWNHAYKLGDSNGNIVSPQPVLDATNTWHTLQAWTPYRLTSDSGSYEGSWGYECSNKSSIQTHVANLQAAGYKVLSYLTGDSSLWKNQTQSKTLDWLAYWFNEFGFDGLYLDGQAYGLMKSLHLAGTETNYDCYLWIRSLREKFGDDLVLLMHSSVDTMFGRDIGGRFAQLLTYANIQLVGETGAVAESLRFPSDNAIRYFIGDYGIGNSTSSFTYNSYLQSSIETQEANRTLAGSIHGAWRTIGSSYPTTHLPWYNQQKSLYQAGAMQTDVIWPPPWWTGINDLTVILDYTNTTFTVTWTTSDNSDSQVAWTSSYETYLGRGFAWRSPNSVLLNVADDPNLVTSHSIADIALTHNQTSTTWQAGDIIKIRVRSTAAGTGTNEKIWGAETTITWSPTAPSTD